MRVVISISSDFPRQSSSREKHLEKIIEAQQKPAARCNRPEMSPWNMHREAYPSSSMFSITSIIQYSPDNTTPISLTWNARTSARNARRSSHVGANFVETAFVVDELRLSLQRNGRWNATQASKYTCRSVSDVCARGIERPGSEIRDPAFHLSVSHTRVDVSTTRDFWFFFAARRLFASPSLQLPNRTAERLFNRIPYEQANARSLALHSAQPWPRFRSKRYCQLRSGRKWIARSPRDI